MPEYIKAYVVIIFLSSFAFYFAKKSTAIILTTTQFNQLRNIWFTITTLAFFSVNFWIFLSITALFVAYHAKKSVQPIALYMAIIAAAPPIWAIIPGFGLVNRIMQIDYLLVLSISLLLIQYFKIKSSEFPFGRVKTDYCVLAYFAVNVGILFTITTPTDMVRETLVMFLAMFLPYYVVSRKVQDTTQLQTVIAAFMITCFPAALIGFFEAGKGWLLYTAVQPALGIEWEFGGYLHRDGLLRASSSFGHSLVFAFAMVVGLGFYLYLHSVIKNKLYKFAGLGLILLGVIAPLSRGPWLGAAMLVCVYLYLGRNGVSNLFKLAFGSAVLFAFLLVSPIAHKVVNLLPFIGKTDQFNADYREQLFETSIVVAGKNPWFGNPEFAKDPDMKELFQGEKIIDLVNIYISVLLNAGYIGLIFYVGMFITALRLAYVGMKKIRNVDTNLFQLGRALIATLISIMFMIAGVGDILVIPYLYYIVIALCIAYSQIVKKQLTKATLELT
jgi:O-antigen ligase